MRPARTALIVLATFAFAAPACLKPPGELPEEPNRGPAGPPSTAGEVLTRHIEGIGGEAGIRAITERTVEAQMVFRAHEDCEEGDENCLAEDQRGSFVLQTTADGRLYRRTVLMDLVEEKGFDGLTGWQLQGGKQLLIEDESERALSKEDAVLHWYFDLEKRGVQVTLVRSRKEDSAGTVMTLDGIRWELPDAGAAPKTMWFDRSTGLLHEEIVEEGEGAELQRQLIVYRDYRDVDGVLVPFSIAVTTQVGDQSQVLEIITERVDHKKLDATAFSVPELPAPEPRPDTLLASLAKAEAAALEDGKDLSALTELARLAFAAARFEKADATSDAILALDSKEPEALLIKARVQLLRGDTKTAARTLAKAKAAGVRDDVLARQEAWIHYREGDYGKLANALDRAKQPVLAGRFRSFVGKPAEIKSAGECVTTVPMTSNEPLAVVEIGIAGKRFPAIVDTGAAHIILSESLAKELGVSIRPLGAASGGPLVGHSQIDSLELGDVTFTNVPVDVFSDEEMSANAGDLGGGIRATLGVSMLSDFLVTVDAPRKVLELVGGRRGCEAQMKARRAGASVPFWLHETHYLYVTAKLQGAEGVYLLNTGIRGTDLAATQVAYSHAGIGAPPLKTNESPSVNVGEVTIGDAFVAKGASAAFGFFEQTQTTDGFRLDGMLGLGVLGQAAFTFDFEERRLFFAPPPTK